MRTLILNRRLAAIWLAPALNLLAGCAPVLVADGELTALPYTLQEDGRIVIQGRIDGGGPYDFAIDTAASISFVSDRVREAQGLAPQPGKSAYVHGLVASGEFPIVKAGRIVIGNETWLDAELVAIPANTPAAATLDGVLGIDFLRRYAVSFSPIDRVVRLYPPVVVSRRSYRGWASIPLTPRSIGATREALYFFDVRIGGQSVPALFDLGAGLNVLNSAGAEYFRLSRRGSDGKSIVSGGVGSVSVLARLASEPMVTGSVRWRDAVFYVGDPEIFSTLSYTDRPLAILGSGLFNNRAFIIDFARNRLLVRTRAEESQTRG